MQHKEQYLPENGSGTTESSEKVAGLVLSQELNSKYADLLKHREVRKILENVGKEYSYEDILSALRAKDEFGISLRIFGEVGKGKVKEVIESFESLGFKVKHEKPDLKEKRAGFVKLSILYREHANTERGF